MCDLPSGSREVKINSTVKVSRNTLFSVLRTNNMSLGSPSQCVEHLINYIKNKFNLSEVDTSNDYLQNIMTVFVKNLKVRWNASKRVKNRFFTKYGDWLRYEYEIKIENKRGRPKKLFSESSEKTKSRDSSVHSAIASTSTEKLTYAAVKSMRLSGKRKTAEAVALAANASPKSLKRMKTAIVSPSTERIKQYTSTESLALMLDMNLSKENYITMQRGAKERGVNLYAAYSSIAQEKKLCYPDDDSITVTETECKINLQSLLDHTSRRLILTQKEVIERISAETNEINLLYKWGIDGSGGHSIYNQIFSDADILYADSNIVFSNLVPLEMSSVPTSTSNTQNREIYWKNQTSTTRYCRPIKFILEKETKENVKQHYNEIKDQINNISPTEVTINGRTILVQHILLSTMFDGKILNILTGTAASQRCYICGALPKDMNNLEKVSKMESNEDYYDFGIPCLHSYIRTFELLLHISYKMQLKQWQARGPELKRIVKEAKENICKKFYEEMGLVVDMPKQGGGNSNNGNTARRFFADPEKVAYITGIDSNLIQRFSIILSTLASGYEIDVTKFKKYCSETAKIYVQLYSWYPMSVTVHKVLIHSPNIIERMKLPIGQLSEDVQESRQKDWKNIRLQHTRKTSRVNTNRDIINHLLISSDPVVSSCRKPPRKSTKPFKKEVIELLKNLSPHQLYNSIDEPSSSDEE